MYMYIFNFLVFVVVIVVFLNLFCEVWMGNNIFVFKGVLKFCCVLKFCFVNFFVKFWLKRWEIVVYGFINMKNFWVLKIMYLFIRFYWIGILFFFIGSYD